MYVDRPKCRRLPQARLRLRDGHETRRAFHARWVERSTPRALRGVGCARAEMPPPFSEGLTVNYSTTSEAASFGLDGRGLKKEEDRGKLRIVGSRMDCHVRDLGGGGTEQLEGKMRGKRKT